MSNAVPPGAEPLAANINAVDVALNALLNVLERRDPGIKAEALAVARDMMARMPPPPPHLAATRELTMTNLQGIFSA